MCCSYRLSVADLGQTSNKISNNNYYFHFPDFSFGGDRCSSGSIRVGNASEVSLPFSSTTTYTGRVEICDNGEYVDVCNNTVEAQYFANRSCEYYSSDYSKYDIVGKNFCNNIACNCFSVTTLVC